jgi:hypothetical protein
MVNRLESEFRSAGSMSASAMMRKSRCAPGEIRVLGSYAGISSQELSLLIVRIHTGDGENVFK